MISSYIASINFIEKLGIKKGCYNISSINRYTLSNEKKAFKNSKKILEDKFVGSHNFSEQRGYGSNPEANKTVKGITKGRSLGE